MKFRIIASVLVIIVIGVLALIFSPEGDSSSNSSEQPASFEFK